MSTKYVSNHSGPHVRYGAEEHRDEQGVYFDVYVPRTDKLISQTYVMSQKRELCLWMEENCPTWDLACSSGNEFLRNGLASPDADLKHVPWYRVRVRTHMEAVHIILRWC